MFGDFQSLKPNPDEHRIQPIESSHLVHELLNQTEALQNLLTSQATGGSEDDAEFVRPRLMLLFNPALDSLVPRLVRTCRNPFRRALCARCAAAQLERYAAENAVLRHGTYLNT